MEISSKPATRAASSALLIQKPFLEVEVAEFLFDGYVDGFLDQVGFALHRVDIKKCINFRSVRFLLLI